MGNESDIESLPEPRGNIDFGEWTICRNLLTLLDEFEWEPKGTSRLSLRLQIMIFRFKDLGLGVLFENSTLHIVSIVSSKHEHVFQRW